MQFAAVLADGGAADKPSDSRDYYEVLQPDGRKLVGGLGEPRTCQPPGKDRFFHDGAGLLSMGRWDVEKHIWSMGQFWKRLRKETVSLVEQHLGDAPKTSSKCEKRKKIEKNAKMVKSAKIRVEHG